MVKSVTGVKICSQSEGVGIKIKDREESGLKDCPITKDKRFIADNRIKKSRDCKNLI